jgi:dTDP-4-amino-4,6-dideoxygalactose transaminase
MFTTGKHMIPINKPVIGEEERHEVLEVLDENSSLTSPSKDGGKKVQDFEQLLRQYLHIKHAVAVNSGTAALYSSLLALGLKHGEEVILPSFTFVATANAVVAAGGKPVFIDISKHGQDYNIDPLELKSKFTKKTRVVLPVHLYGNPANLDEIEELLQRYTDGNVSIVEDACQSLGSTYKKKQTGTFGIMGCFSMYASKVMTSGEGGAIVTDNDEIAARLKMIRNHGMVEGYDTRILGLNSRLPEMSAALAKAQMSKLPQMLERRRHNAKLMTELLSTSSYKASNIAEHITLPETHEANKESNWYLYTLAFKRDGIRDIIQKKLVTEYKIGAAVYYDPPVHKTPFYDEMVKMNALNLENTDWASKHVLSLPVHPLVTDQEINFIASSLIEVLSNQS